MMEPVTSQPSFGFEDQGIFGGQKPVLSGLEKLSKVNELKVHHGRLTCVEGNLKKKLKILQQIFNLNSSCIDQFVVIMIELICIKFLMKISHKSILWQKNLNVVTGVVVKI